MTQGCLGHCVISSLFGGAFWTPLWTLLPIRIVKHIFYNDLQTWQANWTTTAHGGVAAGQLGGAGDGSHGRLRGLRVGFGAGASGPDPESGRRSAKHALQVRGRLGVG